jgi:hypothetical protein
MLSLLPPSLHSARLMRPPAPLHQGRAGETPAVHLAPASAGAEGRLTRKAAYHDRPTTTSDRLTTTSI